MPKQKIFAMLSATVQVFNDNEDLVYSKTTDYNSEVRCSYDPNDKLVRSNILGQSESAYLSQTSVRLEKENLEMIGTGKVIVRYFLKKALFFLPYLTCSVKNKNDKCSYSRLSVNHF